MLNSEKKEDGPEEIHELGGEYEQAERRLGRCFLGGECDTEVADEHRAHRLAGGATLSLKVGREQIFVRAGLGGNLSG
ncbi:MAG TPA: hypothetical protein VMH85_15070 [Terriglobales bacterium]|nr:hypothetical protein [Terriglobales bacterium]